MRASRPRVVVDALGLSTGGGISGVRQLIPWIPNAWDTVVLVTPALASTLARSSLGETHSVDLHVVRAAASRWRRLALEHVVEPVRWRRRGYDWWIGLGNVPAACWRRNQVVLLQSAFSYTSAYDHMLGTAGDRLVARVQRAIFRLRRRTIVRVIVPSLAAKHDAASLTKGVAVDVCPWGVERSDLVAREPVRPGARVTVLTVANLYRHKNLDVLVEALALLRPRWDIELRVIGSPIDRAHLGELQRLAMRHGVLDTIRFLDEMAPDRVRDELRRANVYALLSTIESFGMTWLEGQAAGLPVVAPDIPVAREVLGGAAWFVDPFDARDVAAAIEEAATDPSRHGVDALRNVDAHAADDTARAFWGAIEGVLGR